MPDGLMKAVSELNAVKTMTMHHSKYAMAVHEYDAPLINNQKLIENDITFYKAKLGKYYIGNTINNHFTAKRR